eukprot:TRINITY_DN10025_c1_g1_i3.p2 TRINITY_DN10025_c1_g1~~TRINITY_DN10025_c1_g1_i3.p2  ORF type:complete len:123 (-),score=9.81 TRINITY_DN10025_c1_g1_i3:322-690(-)
MAALEKALARLRTNDPSLTRLDLARINIGPEGAAHLADALRVNTSLERLDLWGNNIGPEGAAHLADALRVNTSLKRLDLSVRHILRMHCGSTPRWRGWISGGIILGPKVRHILRMRCVPTTR